MSKILSLILAMLMLLSVFTVSFAEEPTVLTIYSKGEHCTEYFETSIFDEVESRLNIKIELTVFDSDSFAAMLAGGDLGDIILSGGDVSAMLASGLALDLNPYIDESLPNLKNDTIIGAMETSRQLISPDGGLYLLPTAVGFYMPIVGGLDPRVYRGYVVRWDYYKELGYPEINNDDDYIAVLQQMLENHPINEDGTPNLLYGSRSDLFHGGGYRAAFKEDVAVDIWGNYQYDNDIFTNEVYDGYLDVEHSPYWDNMIFLNKIYRLGLYDEDCFTMTTDEYTAKVAAGKYMGLQDANDALYNARVGDDPDTDAFYCVVPSKGMTNVANIDQIMGNMPSNYIMVSKNAKNLDAALAFVNLMFDLDFMRWVYSGEQGVDWDYDENGVPKMTEEALAAIASSDSKWKIGTGNGGHGAHNPYAFGYNPAVKHPDGYPLALTFEKSAAIASQQSRMLKICEAYGVEYWADAYANVEKDWRNDLGEAIAACVTDISMDDKRIIQACEDILTTGMATMIMSESDEEFAANRAEIIAEMEALGEAEVFQRYKEQFDAVRDVMVEQHIKNAEANGIELYPGLE